MHEGKKIWAGIAVLWCALMLFIVFNKSPELVPAICVTGMSVACLSAFIWPLAGGVVLAVASIGVCALLIADVRKHPPSFPNWPPFEVPLALFICAIPLTLGVIAIWNRRSWRT